jgi:hypothetical protein
MAAEAREPKKVISSHEHTPFEVADLNIYRGLNKNGTRDHAIIGTPFVNRHSPTVGGQDASSNHIGVMLI